jgi:hypothetical protein
MITPEAMMHWTLGNKSVWHGMSKGVEDDHRPQAALQAVTPIKAIKPFQGVSPLEIRPWWVIWLTGFIKLDKNDTQCPNIEQTDIKKQ